MYLLILVLHTIVSNEIKKFFTFSFSSRFNRDGSSRQFWRKNYLGCYYLFGNFSRPSVSALLMMFSSKDKLPLSPFGFVEDFFIYHLSKDEIILRVTDSPSSLVVRKIISGMRARKNPNTFFYLFSPGILHML